MSEEKYHRQAIYGLANPETGELGYIGKSQNPLKRLGTHLIGNDNNEAKKAWIESLPDVPRLIILEELNGHDRNSTDREEYWIQHYLALGHPLTNINLRPGYNHDPPEIRKWVCSECGRGDIPHQAHGMCHNCYMKWYREQKKEVKKTAWEAGYDAGVGACKVEWNRERRTLEEQFDTESPRNDGRKS